jgi:alcohol dehydrogenase (cytochrome c)
VRSGERRAVLTGIPGKTGLIYTLDRATGEFLWARPTITQNVVASIDDATGRAEIAADTLFTAKGQTVFVCPSSNGGKNWPAGAYSPRTGTMYFPMANTCMNSTSIAEEATAEMTYAIDNETVITPGKDMVGAVYGISAETGKLAWRYEQRAGVMGLVATGGDLIFIGDVAGKLRALGATTGRPLWEIDLGSPVSGHPVTFAVDGKQYVAVSTGRANLTGALARLTPDARASGNASKLVVLALPD